MEFLSLMEPSLSWSSSISWTYTIIYLADADGRESDGDETEAEEAHEGALYDLSPAEMDELLDTGGIWPT